MAVDGMKLTFPNGDVYSAEGNIQAQFEQQPSWILSGGGTPIAVAKRLFDDFGDSATVRTPKASGHLGVGGGSHTFEFRFDKWDGESDDWGPSASSEDPVEKMITFNMELARAGIDSLNPATLEFSILSDDTQAGTGDAIDDRYSSMPVVPAPTELGIDFSETGGSLSSMNVSLVETIDLSNTIDTVVSNTSGVGADFSISSTASGATDELPIQADTLGDAQSRRGTGAQQQGAETAASNLAQKNDAAGAASPTTRQTSVTPAGVLLRGAFRGANASDLASKLKTQYLSNSDIDEDDPVTLATEGVTGTTYPMTGDYLIDAGNSRIDPLVPAVTSDAGVYGYQLDLQEV